MCYFHKCEKPLPSIKDNRKLQGPKSTYHSFLIIVIWLHDMLHLREKYDEYYCLGQ